MALAPLTLTITIKPTTVTNLKVIYKTTNYPTSDDEVETIYYQNDMSLSNNSYTKSIETHGSDLTGETLKYSLIVSADGYKTVTLENQTSSTADIVLEPLSIEEIQLNGTIYKIKDSFHQVVTELPENPDPNIFYYIVEE